MSSRELEAIIDEAAQWMMRLNSGLCSDEERRSFEQWRSHHPQHAKVFEQMSGQSRLMRSQHLRGVKSHDLIRTLGAPSSRRRFLSSSLAVFGIGITSLVLARWSHWSPALPGDLQTAVAERRTFHLADGSELTLNADSRVTPHVTDEQRSLHLQRGMMRVYSFESPRGPMQIETRLARLSAPSGLFNVGLTAQHLQLSVLESRIHVHAAEGRRAWVEAGQKAVIDAQGEIAISPVGTNDSAWLTGLLEVDNQPLSELVEALRAYRHGVLSIDKDVAPLRVSGLFTLDDPERTLRQLSHTLPVRVERYSDFWLRIRRA